MFDRLRARVREENPGLFAILNGTRLVGREAGQLTLLAPSTFSRQRLEDRAADLEAMCGQFFGEPTRIALREIEVARKTAAAPRREDERRTRQEALNHPVVNVALEVLEADIVEIRPLGGSGGSPR